MCRFASASVLGVVVAVAVAEAIAGTVIAVVVVTIAVVVGVVVVVVFVVGIVPLVVEQFLVVVAVTVAVVVAVVVVAVVVVAGVSMVTVDDGGWKAHIVLKPTLGLQLTVQTQNVTPHRRTLTIDVVMNSSRPSRLRNRAFPFGTPATAWRTAAMRPSSRACV